MDDIAEKRVFAGRESVTTLVVAAAPGLVRVSVAGDRVGEFGLARRCDPTDLAFAAGRLVVATDEDVLLSDGPADGLTDASAIEALAPTGFGPAAAVSFDGDRPVAASPKGRLAALEGDGWTALGELSASPVALDGDLVATAEGVFRLATDGPVPAGLADVRDVGRVGGIPLAATATGLFELGNGWMDAIDCDIRVVAGTPDGRAHAAAADALYERAAGEWRVVDPPTDGRVAGLAHGDRAFGATAGGELLVQAVAGWRAHALGVPDVVALAAL